jgi:hypothetical protein
MTYSCSAKSGGDVDPGDRRTPSMSSTISSIAPNRARSPNGGLPANLLGAYSPIHAEFTPEKTHRRRKGDSIRRSLSRNESGLSSGTGSAAEAKRVVSRASSTLRGTDGSNPLPSIGECRRPSPITRTSLLGDFALLPFGTAVVQPGASLC